jgi:hypothetical protein
MAAQFGSCRIPLPRLTISGQFRSRFPPPDRLRIRTRRTSAKVADDDGVISVETALRDYGVVVSAKGAVDEAATTRTRVSKDRMAHAFGGSVTI